MIFKPKFPNRNKPNRTLLNFDIDAGSEDVGGQWSATYCRNDRSSLCQKPTGVTCPDGWIYHKIQDVGDSHDGNKCYKFFLNGRDHLPWYVKIF